MPWQHVMCVECGRLYDTLQPVIREDGLCDCGKPLLPAADPENFTARPVCLKCAGLLVAMARQTLQPLPAGGEGEGEGKP